ncbi:hypothetical protein CY652_20665 [Burkholderia sp. WAC0059]|nr:hypothetical protein CY652_20665 [Burkholderia sp. WAC0059]
MNAQAESLLTRSETGLRLVRSAYGGDRLLSLRCTSPADALALKSHIESVIRNGHGSWLRIQNVGTLSAFPPTLALSISRMPPEFLDPADGPAPPWALVIAQDISTRQTPTNELLSGLFEFTRAERLVAIALTGGATASEVANARGVSLDTVRHQIREVLRKSGARNLRDFERIVASALALQALTDSVTGITPPPIPRR